MKKLIYAIAFLLSVSFSTASAQEKPCNSVGNILKAVAQLKEREFPRLHSLFDAYLGGVLDIKCLRPAGKPDGEEVHTAVVDLYIRISEDKILQGIFRIYYNSDGHLKGSNLQAPWRLENDSSNFPKYWCDFIKENYSNEIKKQGCHMVK